MKVTKIQYNGYFKGSFLNMYIFPVQQSEDVRSRRSDFWDIFVDKTDYQHFTPYSFSCL